MKKHGIIFVAITVLLDTIGFGLIIPVMPRLLVDLTGDTLSRAAIDGGWLSFVYAAMQFVFAPVLGNLSDRFGRRPVLLAAIGCLGIDYIIMGLAPTLAWLFVGRAISGIAGASFTPAYAYVADISPPERRAQNFGVVGSMFGIEGRRPCAARRRTWTGRASRRGCVAQFDPTAPTRARGPTWVPAATIGRAGAGLLLPEPPGGPLEK